MRSCSSVARRVGAGLLAIGLWTAGAGAGLAHDSEPHGAATQPADAQPGAVQPGADESGASAVDFSPFPADIGGPFTLVDHTGNSVSDTDFRGRYMLVFFGYARCEAICPVGLKRMTEALDLLGEAGAPVAPLLITVDPAADTPEALAVHVPTIHPRLIGLTGSPDEIAAVMKAYKVKANETGRSWKGGPLISHGSLVYLMGPDGALLSVLPPVLGPEAMAGIIRRYLS